MWVRVVLAIKDLELGASHPMAFVNNCVLLQVCTIGTPELVNTGVNTGRSEQTRDSNKHGTKHGTDQTRDSRKNRSQERAGAQSAGGSSAKLRHCGRPECVGLNAGQPTQARHGMSLTLQLR